MTAEDPRIIELSGWGRTAHTRSRVLRPTSFDGLADLVLGEPAVTVRGAGKSYGDAALPGDGVVLDMTGQNQILSLDRNTGVVIVEGGVLLKDIIERTLRSGWLLPVIPGTERITVGGAIASDVHGKNHPGAGSFGHHVLWLDLLRSDGTVTRLSAGQDPDGFWATIGGMGLTGVTVRAAIQLQRVETGWAIQNRQRTRSLEGTLNALRTLSGWQETDPDRHVIAWLDGSATGSALGRGIIDEFRPASSRDLPGSVAPYPERRVRTGVPRSSLPGPGVVSRRTIGAASTARWWLSRPANARLVPLSTALCPLDGVESWPAAFGRGGLVQYQLAVPADRAEVIHDVLSFLADRQLTPALVTLKNFGFGNAGPLSFPIPGWTLALDLPARWLRDPQLFRPIDSVVADAGGRVYLAKDTVVDPGLIPQMYPRLPTWRQTRSRLDPVGRWTSALAERLGLVP